MRGRKAAGSVDRTADGRCPGILRRLGLGMLVAALMSSSGCLTGRMAPARLPESPIAFLYWEANTAKKRAALFEKAAKAPSRAAASPESERARLAEVRAYLRGEKTAAIRAQLARHPGRLSLYWPRTGEIERVEAAPPGSMPLAWSADRKRLLFSSAHRGGREQLYEYHVERRDLSPITIGPDEHARGDYRPGGFVVHWLRSSRRGNVEQGVSLADPGGRLGRVVARGVPPGTLRFAPEALRIVYEQVRVHRRIGGRLVFESSIATRRLAPGAEEVVLARGREPALSPDGRWIVFASPSSAGYRLRRMRIDGTSRVPINPGGTDERMPTVSPDGEFVAFIRRVGSRRVLAVRRFDGTGDRVLVPAGWSEFPVW